LRRFRCISERILDVAGGIVHSAFCLVELAFRLQLLVARNLAGCVFDLTFRLIGGAS
jgi:hypothetical protein